MTIRSYAGLLVLEDIFDYIPTTNFDVVNLANQIFSPNLQVVEADCGTTLGYYETVNYDIQGDIELATDEALGKDRIDELLADGTYTVAVRSSKTCISSAGICQKCYNASFPRTPAAVNDRVTVYPEYALGTDVVEVEVGDSVLATSFTQDEYSFIYVYADNVLLDESTYTVTDTAVTLNTAATVEANYVISYTSYNRATFLMFLARTYSGSVLGMKPLPADILPVRSLLTTSLIDTNMLSIVEGLVTSSKVIPGQLIDYLERIVDNLEKSLYLLVLISLYNYVS